MSNTLPPFPYLNAHQPAEYMPQDQPIVTVEQLASPVRSHRFLRKLGATAAALGAAAGIVGATIAVTEKIDGAHVAAYELTDSGTYDLPHTTDIAPSTLQGPDARVDHDIRRALSVDTCDTKVTPEAVMGTYQRLFGKESEPADDAKTLQLQSGEVADRLQQATQRLDFAEFPADDYSNLYNDAFSGDPQISLSEYHQVLDRYASQLGLQTAYSWKPGSDGAPDARLIKPIDPVEAHSDIMARRAMVDFLGGLSFMPRELIAESGARRVVFGDIVDKSALGEVSTGGTDIFVDVAMFTNDKTGDLSKQDPIMQVVAPHEDTHHLQDRLCWQVLKKYAGEDNAMRSLNQGVYIDDQNRNKPSGVAHTLESKDAGSIVGARNYGQDNNMEDTATIAEDAIFAPNAHILYSHDTNKQQDLAPLREKVALILTRIQAKDPQLATYYISVLQAGRLEMAAQEKMEPLYEKLNQMFSSNPDVMHLPRTNPLRREYVSLSNQVLPYDSVYQDLSPMLTVGATSYRK